MHGIYFIAGRVLQFLTTQAMKGDRAKTTTTQLNITSPSCLGFKLFLNRHTLDTIGRLRVYAYTSEIMMLLWEDSGLICFYGICWAHWTYNETTLPLGFYHIVFEATQGFQDKSSILLDDVNVYSEFCKNSHATREANSKFHFSKYMHWVVAVMTVNI